MSNTDFESYLDSQDLPKPGVIEVDEPQEQEAVEPEAVETIEEPEPPVGDEPELILGKYKTAEDLADAYKNLEREKGRLAQEVGELRQQTQQVPQPPPTPVNPASVEEAFIANPAAAREAAKAAAVRALQQGDTSSYDQIIETWGQYDSFGALRFDTQKQTLEAQQQFQRELAPHLQTSAQYVSQQANDQAEKTVRARHADFDEIVGPVADNEAEAQRLIESGFPPALIQLANGTQAEREHLLETLYRWRKAEQAEHAPAAAAEVAAKTAAQQREAKQLAGVASASSTPSVESTSEDPELDAFYEFLKAPNPTSWSDHRPTGQ